MAVFNFLNVSPTYRASVGRNNNKEVCTRRDILTAEAGLTDEYLWPTRKADIPRLKEVSAERGVAISDSTLKYDHGTLRTTYLFLTGDESERAAILQKLERKDPYCFAVGCFLKDGITSWEAVQQLAMKPVVITETEVAEDTERTLLDEPAVDQTVSDNVNNLPTIVEEVLTLSLPEAGDESAVSNENLPVSPEVTYVAEPRGREEEEETEEVLSSEILLRLARDEFEHLKRAGALAVQLLERLTRENAELRERIELLEETIAASPTLKEVPELAQLLGVTDRFADQEEKELEKICGELPCASPHHGNKKVAYQDRFLDEFHDLDKADAKRVVKQLKALFNKGPKHSSVLSERLWHHDLPGTPKGAWCSRAGGGGPHGLRFTWQATDTEVTVFGLYHRNDLF